MNTHERLLVSRLVTRLAQALETPKDPDMQLEIDALLRVRPDAPYRLAQYALVLEAELEHAQARLEAAEAATTPAAGAPATSLARAAGPAAGWGNPAAAIGEPSRVPPGVAPVPSMPAAIPAAIPPASVAPTAAGSGGFLRNAATIGAGVLGGSLLFQGIEALFHGGGGAGGLAGGRVAPVEVFETNNFFDERTSGRGGPRADGAGVGGDGSRNAFGDSRSSFDDSAAAFDDSGNTFDDAGDWSAGDDSLA